MPQVILLCSVVFILSCVAVGAENLNDADYVIPGGGSAACALAEVLSRDPTTSVVVLERGVDNYDTFKHEAAIGFEGIPRDRPDGLDHMFSKEDVELFPGFTIPHRSLYVGTAEVLGGGPAVVAGVMQRPSPIDFERWNSDVWTFENTNEDWREMERRVTYVVPAPNPNAHGENGTLTVTTFPLDSNAQLIAGAYQAHFGYGWNEDSNAGDITGLHSAPRQVAMDPMTGRAVRQDTCSTLLSAAVRAARPNLVVLTGAYVTKIEFKTDAPEGLRADAVQYYVKGEVQKRIKVKKELILSAGVIGTPRLLQLSGVGPCSELEALGIECVFDQPAVGANLRTNAQVGVGYFSWLDPFYGTPGAITTGYIRTPYADPMDGGAPDGEITYQGLNLAPQTNIWLFQTLFHELPNTGSVRLRSDSPFADPEIVTRMFETETEALPLASLIQDVRAIMDSILIPVPYVGLLNPFTAIGDIAAVPNDINVIAKWLTTAGVTGHRVGTCALGEVVDDELRVIGIKNLRIADNSIVPVSNRGHATAGEAALIGAVAGRLIVEEA